MFQITNFLGRTHPLLVHLPIGILLLAVLFELLARRERYAALRPALQPIAGWGALSAIVSCVAGYWLAESGGYEAAALDRHRWLGIGVALVATAYYVAKRWELGTPRLHALMTAAMAVLLTGAGHLGGTLTHGEDYLADPLMVALGRSPVKPARVKPADPSATLVYRDMVEPVLAEKCYACHNDKKQKGGLRMDTPDWLFKGGKHGPVIVSGTADKSELYKRLILPASDEHHMPPRKPFLTEQEVALVQWWIDAGAPIDKKAADIAPTAAVQPLLAALGTGGSVAAQPEAPEFSTDSVPAADPQAIAALRALNISVDRLDERQPWLSVNCINRPTFSDAEAKLLLPLKDQLVWLKCNNTSLTDAGMATIGQLRQLTRLRLENTAVGDAGVAALKDMNRLQHLNLLGTAVSDRGLTDLAVLKSLKKVYLWQTKATPAGVAALRQALPGAEVDFGMELMAK